MPTDLSEEDEPMSEGSDDFDYKTDSDLLALDDYALGELGDESPMAPARKAKFRILRHEDLVERQQEVINEIAELLCAPANEVVRVLRFYKWDAAKLQDEWFADPEGVRAKVGLFDEVPSTRRKEATCVICFESFPVGGMAAARCKHYFCRPCWTGYAHTAIEAGPACLDLRCPIPECRAVVPTSLVESVCDESHLRHYREFALRSFVDDNKHMAWCTAPGCTAVAEALVEAPREPLDINCVCGNAFCFTCKEEAHRPVDCETVRKWLIKNSAESENMTWILANTKPCPKCTRPIEKNQGCMHMTCSQCRYEFCWLCQGPWAEHGERTGGFYNCNTYKRRREAGEIDETEERRAHARASLERYMHYWQRWAEHDKARRTALKQLAKWETEDLETLAMRTATPVSQLRFVLDAWREVVSCRRILKWTYAVGFYAFDDPETYHSPASRERATAHKEFFEFTQQDAEIALERMNSKVETKLPAFVADKERKDPVNPVAWAAFREELIGLTDVTRSHFVKLVDFLEKGLDEGLAEFRGEGGDSDMEDEAAGPSSWKEAAAENAISTTSKNNGGETSAPGRRSLRLFKRARGDATGQNGTPPPWVCRACTYVNDGHNTQCDMCDRSRPR